MGYQNFLTQVDADGNATMTDLGEIPFWSLDPAQVAVVLLACKGIITLDEAVNITRLPAEHLVNEAQAWAVAGGNV